MKQASRPDARLYRDDPAGYVRNVLKGVPWWKQDEIFRKATEPPYRILIRSGHAVGKSWLEAGLACWSHESRKARTIITAPTKQSVRDIVFAELRTMRPTLPGLMPHEPRAYVSPKHEILGYTANKGESFAGRHAEWLTLLYDEATGIAPVYFEVGKTLFKGIPSHLWVCSYNPTDPTSQVYHEECTNDWHVVTISQLDHPNIAAELRGEPPPYPSAVRLAQVIAQLDEYSTRMRADEPHDPKEVSLSIDGEFVKHPEGGVCRWLPGALADIRVLGRWPGSGGDTVWSEDLWAKVEATRHDLNPIWKVQIGCDVARYGFDDTAIVVKQGPCILFIERHNGWSTKQTAQRLRELCHRYHGPHTPKEVPVLVDGVGVGGGVCDQAEGLLFIDVQAGAESTNPRTYYRMRSELWFEPLEHAKAGLIDVSRLPANDRQRLKTELLATKYDVDPMERKRVEPKLMTRDRIKRSPDLADAFNLCCYWVHE